MDAIKKIKNPKIRLVVIIAVVVIAAIIALYELISAPSQTADTNNTFLSAHFIDVGQGDCTLFVSGDKTMLIDSGEAEYGDTVVSYIKKLGITELDYVVATHAHSDHMGSMAYVIENFDVKNVILSEPSDSAMSKKFYGDFLDAVERTEAEIIMAEPDYTFILGKAECTILAPFEVSDEENNNSVVMHILSPSASFLMTGDAEKAVEKQLIEKYPHLRATVLKAGHHGSKTSSHKEFIEKLNTDTVIISVGEDNSYNHPSKDVLGIYNDNGLDVYRTDIYGTVTVDCFLNDFTVSTEK